MKCAYTTENCQFCFSLVLDLYGVLFVCGAFMKCIKYVEKVLEEVLVYEMSYVVHVNKILS